MNYRGIVILFYFGLLLAPCFAQDSTVVSLPPVTVEATRRFETYTTAARSIFIRQHEVVDSEPGLSLQRVLRGLPGIQISERGHYALGERLLVRGMGYRAAFGVRGLQAFLNGVPLTMPDGQSMLDIVDPVFIGHSELLRGPSSLFWGNASGGVLHLASIKSASALRLRYMVGSYGLNHLLGSSNFRIGSHKVQIYASRVSKDGYRVHSKGSFLRAGLTTQTISSPRTVWLLTVNLAIQDVLSPGSLSLDQLSINRKQADPRSVRMVAGKASTHLQGGVTLHTQTSLGNLSTTIYGVRRSLENPLTFAWSELERVAGGLYAQLQTEMGSSIRLTTGLDLRKMRDDRLRFNNNAGRQGDRTLLDQQENVGSIAVFSGLSTQISSRFGLSAGFRLDQIRFALTDQFLTNGDQSGSRNFTAFSPSIGLFFRATPLTWYTNLGTAFETPTTTELINSPSNNPGFNSDLNPQHTFGVEAGVRGRVDDLELDLAIFSLRINDRLLPQQGEDGRTWYTNGGKNRHSGAEIAIEWPVDSPVGARIVYNYGSFIFLNNPGEGLRIPGVPTHQLHATLHGSTSNGWNAQFVLESVSKMWVNNGNSTYSDGFTVLDIYLTRSDIRIGRLTLQPFVRIQNVLNSHYVRSLIVNAFGGRYFEPAEGRSFQAGIGIHL